LSDKDHLESIRNVFTGLYPLDDSTAGKNALAAVLSNPTSFVLKPQREGYDCLIKILVAGTIFTVRIFQALFSL
jgi:hypothetical protein